MEILTENYRQERKTLSQTAAKFKYSDQKRNENRPIREELERNIQTQFQLQKSGKKLKMITVNHNTRILN